MNRNSGFARKSTLKSKGKKGSKTADFSSKQGSSPPNKGPDPDFAPKSRASKPKRARPNLKTKGGTNQRKSYGHKNVSVSVPNGRNDGQNTRRSGSSDAGSYIYGIHAGKAVLDNPKRTIHKILMTESLALKWELDISDPNYNDRKITLASPKELDKLLGHDTVHQGLAILAAPLPQPDLDTIINQADGLILVLDQVSDPHNVGAMFRLCAAFNVKAIIMQSRNAPPLTGATAKVAVGTVENVPCIHVTNIANTLLTLQGALWNVTGLAGDTDLTLKTAMERAPEKRVLVMGAEGPGLRDRVKKSCDQLAKIPMLGGAESLNVATAAAIAIYEATRG